MERVAAIIVGAQRTGKTFFCEKQLESYARKGGVSVVYNVGRPGDFNKFISVSILTVDEWVEKYRIKNGKNPSFSEIPRKVEFFKIGEKVFPLKDFCKMFRGKCVKIERVISGKYRSEDFFISAIYKYFYNTFIVFDDCRVIFRRGLSSEMCGLLSRINHSGKQYAKKVENIGIDIALVYHYFKAINEESYAYANLVVQFSTVFAPKLPISADEIEPQVLENYQKLAESEKYCHIEYNLLTQENTFFGP